MSTETQTVSDEALAALAGAAMAGDRPATHELLSALNGRIGRYCQARIDPRRGASASAEDVVQEALLGVYTALETYRDRDAPLLPLAYGIARNKVADYYRKNGHERHTNVDELPERADTRPGPEMTALCAERNAALRALLDTLTERQREIVIFRSALGYSVDETAELVGTTPGAVRVTHYRALRLLRARINMS